MVASFGYTLDYAWYSYQHLALLHERAIQQVHPITALLTNFFHLLFDDHAINA